MGSEYPRRFSPDRAPIDPALANRIFSFDGEEVLGYWNGLSIDDLARELERIEEDADPNYAGLPHGQNIPEDLRDEAEKDYPIWACDVTGRCLVGENATRIENADAIREHYHKKHGGLEKFKELLRIEREQKIESLRLKKG
ncbi:MAG: hypothetical protein HY579_05365 [Nitrospinae bacterium]|nr:hypothetical protein [Nitrospinota bacterium]